MDRETIIELVKSNVRTLEQDIELIANQSSFDSNFWEVTSSSNMEDEGGILYVVHAPSQRVFPVSSSIPPALRIKKVQQILGASTDG